MCVQGINIGFSFCSPLPVGCEVHFFLEVPTAGSTELLVVSGAPERIRTLSYLGQIMIYLSTDISPSPFSSSLAVARGCAGSVQYRQIQLRKHVLQ